MPEARCHQSVGKIIRETEISFLQISEAWVKEIGVDMHQKMCGKLPVADSILEVERNALAY